MSYKVAEDYSIPLVVAESSNRIAERLPKGGRIYQWSTSYFKEVIRGEVPLKEVKEYLHLPQNFHNSTLRSMSQRVLPSQKIEIVPLPDCLDWNEHAILNTLKSELSWRQRADRYHHIDCIMESVNDYFKQKKWGFSAAMRYSMLVRTGQITRDEALKLTNQEEKKNSQEPPELKLWLKLLNLSKKDLEGFEERSQHPYIRLQKRLQNATDNRLRKASTRP